MEVKTRYMQTKFFSKILKIEECLRGDLLLAKPQIN